MAASKTPKHHTRRRSEKKRKHCTYRTTTSSNDVLSILAMLHFGGKGDYELTLSYAISLSRIRSRLTGSSRENFIIPLRKQRSIFASSLLSWFHSMILEMAADTGQSPESCRKQMFASNSFNAVVGLASSASLSNAMGTGRGILLFGGG